MGSLNGKLSPTTMQELINNTAFTEQEINEWYAGFKRDSPNGTVNLEEFKRIYGQVYVIYCGNIDISQKAMSCNDKMNKLTTFTVLQSGTSRSNY